MKRSEIRDELLAEHRSLRVHVEASRQMAERWTHGDAKWDQVREELTRLADALRDHNLHEERALRDLVGSNDASGKAREHSP
jgi:Spy/CpxP family protein refolding chaperone